MSSKNKPAKFPIIGIGASAGGLEALEDFLRHVPGNSGMAFVLVPHLDPSHASILCEILQRAAVIPVVEAQDQLPVEPNCVYIIPPNRDLAIFHGVLQLTVPELPRGQRMPIDAFLRSLAEDQCENAVGIILSGTGSDGTLGLRAILGGGGLTLVQEPATAKYDDMPTNAIQVGYATYVLPVDQMPKTIAENIKKATHQAIKIDHPDVYRHISPVLVQLRNLTGHDFTYYKINTINRRIARRMAQQAIEDYAVYARFLKENPEEVRTLFKELLINVTSFFRDPEAFAVLKHELLPQLCQNIPVDQDFRVWVAGCATGEEAYSIAILLRELMDEMLQSFRVQIYATDLDDDTIVYARAGFYPPNIVQDIEPERLNRFFTKETNGYRINREIREMIVFATQNVIKDPPFTKLDLLSCRNLLIYLKPELQDRLIKTFHYALKPSGVLFLSSSENIGHHTDLFSLINRKWKFFRSKATLSSIRPVISHLSKSKERSTFSSIDSFSQTKENNIADLTRRQLLQYFAPPSVVTDVQGNALYVYGETGKYLRPALGKASLNVIEMARKGLGVEMRTAIQLAANEGTPTLERAIQIKNDQGYRTVNFSVRPMPELENGQNLLLLSFQDVSKEDENIAPKWDATSLELRRVNELEYELDTLKERYQESIEEQQATNEEMQSTNEELQSTNEELETSKEELQSVNEELMTVNAELHSKIEQLSDMQNDMKNLLDNIQIGIIFLDQHLHIRRFTREAQRIYSLVASDVGRPLSDINSVIQGEDLLGAAQTVLNSLVPYEHEVNVGSDICLMVRIQPYLTIENRIEGVVMTFTDITSRIKSVASQETLMMAKVIVEAVREPLVVLDDSLKVIAASQAFHREFQLMADQILGCRLNELSDCQWLSPDLGNQLEILLSRRQILENYEIECDMAAIGNIKIRLNARPIVSITGAPQLILLAMERVA